MLKCFICEEFLLTEANNNVGFSKNPTSSLNLVDPSNTTIPGDIRLGYVPSLSTIMLS